MMVGINSSSIETSKRIPPNSIGAEIGVWKGETSSKFLSVGLKELHLVDAWNLDAWFDVLSEEEKKTVLEKYSKSLGINKSRESFQSYYDRVYEKVKSKFRSNKNVIIHRIDSKLWFDKIDIVFDWIYVDGDHSYKGCLVDLENCRKVLKNDGMIFGDDYGNKKGVEQAVNEFVLKYGLKLEIFANNQFQINL